MNNNIQNQIDPQTGQPTYANSNMNQQLNNVQPQYNNQVNYQQLKKKNKNLLWIILSSCLIVSVLVVILFSFLTSNMNTRTIMIYMVGSDLESKSGLATVDLQAIDYNKMDNENINVVLIAGGAKKWNNSFISPNETSIYELKENGFQKVKQQSAQNMGNAQTLSNFLNYVYDNYKTDQYDLIFWNHGSAILGSEHDELSNDLLTLAEFKVAFENSTLGGKKKLETISFRTCLNGTIEIAGVLKEYSRYLIASEEVTRGIQDGNVLGFINNIEVTDSAVEYGKKFINSYKEQMQSIKSLYEEYGEVYDIYSTYSIVDLSKIDDLETSLNNLFNDVDVISNYNKVAKIRSNLLQYGGIFDMVDLYNLVYGIKDIAPTKADKVLNDIENAVVYNWATNSQSRGISIYFPYQGSAEFKTSVLQMYNTFPNIKNYSDFIYKFNSIQSSSYKDFSFASNKIDLKVNEVSSDFSLELTDEQKESYAKASYIVFRYDEDEYYLPVYKGNEVKLNGNTLSANIKDKQLKVVATDVEDENIITLIENEITDKYIKYDTKVVLENYSSEDFSDWKMDIATISLIYNKETKTTTIGKVSLNTSNNEKLPNDVVLVDLKGYTTIHFASGTYKIQDENGNYNEKWEDSKLIKGIAVKIGNFEFKQQDFDDGYDYYCVFKIYDVDNNYYYSKLMKMN